MTFKNLKTIVWIIILILIVYAGSKLISSVLRPGTTINLNQASVVKQIQSLNRLETASFTIEKIIEAGTEGNAFQNILYGDKILLIAHATVIAGFDLSKLEQKNVSISNNILTLTLPAPEILSSSLDNEQTRVYDRKRGLLTKGDPNLESQARFAAEQSIREAACSEGILGVASTNADKQLRSMFLSFGFTEVNIIVPTATCQ
jgi:hypothetical protein